MSEAWCPTCCTRHAPAEDCPGTLLATGPERHGWRVHVETPHGHEAYGVLVAPAGDLWRARILTYPNILWMVPGGGGSIKFVATSPAEAESQAIRFIEDHCHRHRFLRRDQVEPVEVARIAAEEAKPARSRRPRILPAPRKLRSVPVRFGVERASQLGSTFNLSETGMFVVTPEPLEPGVPVKLHLEVNAATVSLRGLVIWSRHRRETGRPPGMGIQLTDPSAVYREFVRSLA